MTVQERKAYTDAVLCLQSKPALTTAQAPGAKSRFDDYGMPFNISFELVVVILTGSSGNSHPTNTPESRQCKEAGPSTLTTSDMDQTFFLPWHRYYIWHYENALRTECGYTGYQPVSGEVWHSVGSMR